MRLKGLVRIYWFAATLTVVIWALVGWRAGWSALLTVTILTILETTFSADNAVVNGKILMHLSPFWQRMFLTIGVFTAVFIVRFILPILIVMFGAHISFHEVLSLAVHHPHQYEHALSLAQPAIDAFGGTFLMMIALSYFIDYNKQTHWLPYLEKYLGNLGRFDNVTIFIMLLASLVLYGTAHAANHITIFLAAIAAMALHIGLELLDDIMNHGANRRVDTRKVGGAAVAAFIYLEVLDASFSLDSVIGAFALTSSILLIMAGLGAGAIWVRAMTVHLVRAGTLAKYIFLEHGAHWAIAFLGSVMLLKLYDIDLPQWIVGSLGLVVIVLSIIWSRRTAPGHKTPLVHE